MPHYIDGKTVYICPCRSIVYKEVDYSEVLYLYYNYLDGFLITSGNIYEQPSKYVEFMRICKELDERNKQKLREELRNKRH